VAGMNSLGKEWQGTSANEPPVEQKLSSEAVDLPIRPLPSPLLPGVPRGLLLHVKCLACDAWLHSEDLK